jgi:hypothetical protein
MIKVFIWAPTDNAVGHASCDIHSGEFGRAYISWWPIHDGEEIFGDEAYLDRTFADDCREEGREPTFRVPLTGGFEGNAIRWWRERFLQSSPRWSLLSENCSWVTAQILKIAFPSGILDGCDAWNTVWKPMDIASYAWRIERRLRHSAELQQPLGRAPTMHHNRLRRGRR